MTQDIQDIITAFAWPLAIVIVLVAFMLIFLRPLTRWIDRWKEVSRRGIKSGSDSRQEQPQKPTSSEKTVDVHALMQAFDSATLLEQEGLIRQELEKQGLEKDTETAKVLIRHLSIAQIQIAFERFDSTIFGSQINLLQQLNAATTPMPVEDVRTYYDIAAAAYPDAYKKYSFESWLNFLIGHAALVSMSGTGLMSGAGYQITRQGRDFLAYLVLAGKTTTRLY
ncbi:MAG: hypothetical protein O7B27_12270 [Gammaproteobacteria bacterium]|nr:hypothetical protein [Gammaproteobacteria bacterium]